MYICLYKHSLILCMEYGFMKKVTKNKLKIKI